MGDHFFLELKKDNVQYLLSVTQLRYSFHSRFEIGLLQLPSYNTLGKATFDYVENKFEKRLCTIEEKYNDIIESMKSYLVERMGKEDK